MSALLSVRISCVPAPTLITVDGEIDPVSAGELREHLVAVPDGDVVLDVSGVRLLAAAGLRTLLELQWRCARAGAHLVLAAPSPMTRRVLGLTEFDRNLPVRACVREAIAFVSHRPPHGSVDPRAAG